MKNGWINEKFSELGGEQLVVPSNARYTTIDVEQRFRFKLPSQYRETIERYCACGSLVFANGAKIKIRDEVPISDAEGYVDVIQLFGLRNEYNLVEQTERLRILFDGLERYLAISDSSGGNLFCMNMDDGRIFFIDHESKSRDGLVLAAPDFQRFLSSLIPDP